ncbi:major facilitator superfamily domain-containing protein [Lophiotrema nucula]|uniref:Major facilitator superfamily domain-containing protein n=1 Tax=Lophiotrema nucula TaxID=690887 RepID=A0A6A5Z378_9PLEO|nr:major facilitator superfamily domain-containing protein [Lophiotrema nucula]
MPIRRPEDEPFPTFQLIIVGICRFSEPIAFNSILAYSYDMVQDLGIAEKDAPFYSGLLVSAYAVAEAITAPAWGAISDVYGRKPVALVGLAGVALSCMMFGLAKSYWVALLARFLGGALNGNVAIMQTMVQEMVKNPAHEPKAYATQPFVWTLGGIIGSAMGGFLAQPAHFYPGVFSPDGFWGKFPYFLPNLVAIISIVLAIIQGMLFLDETNPHFEKNDSAIDDESIDERTPLRAGARQRTRGSISQSQRARSRTRSISVSVVDSYRSLRKRPSFMEESLPLPTSQGFDLRRASFGTMHSIQIPDQKTQIGLPRTRAGVNEPKEKALNFTIYMLTLALVLIAYHQMSFISIMPVFVQDPPRKPGLDFIGGLGMNIHDVGTYLAVNGFITLFIQAVIFPPFVSAFGVWKSFTWMVILYPTTYMLVPFVSAAKTDGWVSAGVYLAFILQAFYGIIVFPCALILLKNATPSPLVLGRVNGFVMSACCLARTVGSPLVGAIYSIGGSAAAFFSLALVAVLGIVQLFWVPREHVKVEVESGIRRPSFMTRPSEDSVAQHQRPDFMRRVTERAEEEDLEDTAVED